MKRLISNKSYVAFISALFSAILYAVCIPAVKMIGDNIPSVLTGGLLYLGAGLGLLLTTLFKSSKPQLALTKNEFPYILAMIFLDIAAITSLMFGVANTTAANASLFSNFELAATLVVAFFVFKEAVSKRLLWAIILITFAVLILSYQGAGSFVFNIGTIFVIFACICWGIENNCTRMISSKDTRQITIIKGCCSGAGSIFLALLLGEVFPGFKWVIIALLLGFVSYGISVSLYIYAQRFLGAAKTGAIYSMAPFFGVLFSMLFLGERPSVQFYIALIIMVLATTLVVIDTHNS